MNALGTAIGSSGGVQREQTMEEILASIRKIIESNDAITNPMTGDAAEFDDDKFAAETEELDGAYHAASAQNGYAQKESAQAAASQQPLTHQPALHSVEIDAPAALPVYAAPAVSPPVPVQQPSLQAEMARLVSQSPERRVAAAFDDLNSAFMKSKQMPLEGVAEAMLRPMMKEWLDNNLPNLVERLVREEITRIARGDI